MKLDIKLINNLSKLFIVITGGFVESNKILIVDNDKEFLKELDEMFQINGYETLIHSKPQKALKDVTILKPKIILFDIV